MRLQTDFFTQRSLYRESFYTRKLSTHRSFYTEKPVHREAFTHKRVYTQKLLHKEISTQRSFHMQNLLHIKAFTQRSLYTKKLLRADAFTPRSFYTENSLHKGAFTRSGKLKLAAILWEKPSQELSGTRLPRFLAHPAMTSRSSNPAEPTMSVSSKIRPGAPWPWHCRTAVLSSL